MDNKLNCDDFLKQCTIQSMTILVEHLKEIIEDIKNNGWQNEQWAIDFMDRINKLSVEF